jgi:hypothetical protein
MAGDPGGAGCHIGNRAEHYNGACGIDWADGIGGKASRRGVGPLGIVRALRNGRNGSRTGWRDNPAVWAGQDHNGRP